MTAPKLKITLQFLFLIFLNPMLNSCKKENKEPERTNYLEAKLNGALWSPSSSTCILLEDTTYLFRILNITSTSGGKTVTIEAADNAQAGTINTGSRSFAAGSAYFGYSTTGTPYHTISGTIIITEVEASSKLVSGSFDFTVEDNSGNQVRVTEGKFVRIPFTYKIQ